MVDIFVHIALQGSIAAGRVRVERAAHLHREVRSVLHRLDGEVPGRLDDHCSLATDPGDDGRPVFVIMPTVGLAFFATTTRATPQ